MAWNAPRWSGVPNPFKDIPDNGKQIKKIYVENGKLKVVYEDEEPQNGGGGEG